MRFAEMQANARVHISEAHEAGQQEKPRLSAMHVDANESRRLGLDESALRILEIGDQANATSSRTPSRASSPFTASVTDDRGRPRSSAARLKLRRSTIRVKTRMASKRSIIRPVE